MELTTVADDAAVVFAGSAVRRYAELQPDTEYEFDGIAFRTLPAPGQRLACFATVNDLHFGETVCGQIEGRDVGPVFRSEPGTEPYPERMNRAAIAEIAALRPAAVIAKGDLTSDGTLAQYRTFLDFYEGAFGERLHHVRGNHDAYERQDFVPPAPREIELPGVRIALLDTTAPGRAGGALSGSQLEWLDELAARSDRPLLVFGHHHVWTPDAPRGEDYFGIRADDSVKLAALVARRPAIRGYFAGHTHRNRVVHLRETGSLPWVEVACVKDFPGSWAEYRVYEGGVSQIHHRIAAPEALRWSEKTRAMWSGHYAAYAFGTLAERCFLLPPRRS